MLNTLVLSAEWLVVCEVFWAEIFNVIMMIRFSLEFQLQDCRHLENICRFDLFHIIIGASLNLILFKWINNSNMMITILLLVVVALLLLLLLLRFEIINPNFNGSVIKCCEWMNNFIPHFMMDVIFLFWSVLLKGTPVTSFIKKLIVIS